MFWCSDVLMFWCSDVLMFWCIQTVSISSQISSILHQPSHVPGRAGEHDKLENCLATNFDIAVIRCLFVSKWSEEGIFWSVTYLHRRLKGLNFNPLVEPVVPRKRSNSLPVPKIEVTSHEAGQGQAEQQDKLADISESKLEGQQGEERWGCEELSTTIVTRPAFY